MSALLYGKCLDSERNCRGGTTHALQSSWLVDSVHDGIVYGHLLESSLSGRVWIARLAN